MSKKLKLAIIGSRDYTDEIEVFKFLDKNRDKIEMIVSGGCPSGPDSFAQTWCQHRGVSIIIHYPKWKNDDGTTNRAAGFQRNAKIVKDADYIVAWRVNNSKGTTNTIELAKKAGKPVKVYDFIT